MKFCYCPACKQLRPRNWYARSRCEDCGGQCITFEVQRSIYGYLMFTLDALAVALIVLHVAWYQFKAEWASFYSSVPVDTSTWLIFGLIIVSIAFAFGDIAKSTRKAEDMVLTGLVQKK